MERCLTGVRGIFCAAHFSPEGADHGHDYEAWAFFEAGQDARPLKQKWQSLLNEFDHQRLPAELGWDNQLAAHLGRIINAKRVEICRPLQGIKAVWEQD